MFFNMIKEFRKAKGITQTEFANALHVTQGTVSLWETGKRFPDTETLLDIARFFGVTTDEIMGLSPHRFEDIPEEQTIENSKSICMIPVFDSVSAGFGAYASNYIVDYAPAVIKSGAEDYIYINVKGDSMFPKIEEGDKILVRRQTSVDSGSIAVILIDGEEAVVKKVVYGDDWIELHSINPMYPVRRFNGQDVLRLSVLGLVKQVIKDI